MYMFGEDDNRWTWHSRDGLCCPSIRWLGPGHVHFRPEGKACSSARRISRTCRRQLWTGPRGVGVGALGGLARDSRWFEWPVHAGSWCFTGSVETIVPTKRLGGAADVIGQGCRRCALALCDSKALARAATGRPEVTAGSFPDHPITCCPRLPVFSQRPLHPPAPKNSAFSRSDRHFPLPTPLVRPHRLHLTYRSLHHPLTSSRQPLFAVHHPPRLVTTPQHHTTTHQYVHSHQTPQRPDRI